MNKFFPTVLLALLCLTPALAQTPASPAPAAAAATPAAPADNTFIAPFIDDQTMLVAHLDAAKVDSAAIQQFISSLMDDAKVPGDNTIRADIAEGFVVVDAFLARFKQLGGRHIYALLSHPDIWPHMQPAAFLVKIEPGGNINMMKEFLSSNLRMAHMLDPDATPAAIANGEGQIVQLRDNVLFIGQDAALKRLQTLKPAARQELTLVQSEAALEVEAALTKDQRRAIGELMPLLPPEIGGGSTNFLTRAPLNVQLLVQLPPKPSLTLAFASASPGNPNGGPDPAGFTDINTLILKLRDMLLSSPDFVSAMNDPQVKPHAAEFTGLIKEVLTPSNGALTVTEKQVRQLVPLFKIASDDARTTAQRTASAANIRGLVQSCLVFAAENKDASPESLDTLVKAGMVSAKQLVNPVDGRPYVYHPIFPTMAATPNPSAVPIVWEQADGDNGLNVGFVDGHVEWMAHRSQLDDLVQQAEAQKAKQGNKTLP